MTDKQILAYIRYAHGLYNIVVIAIVCYQGWLGYTIRRRRGRIPLPFTVIRRHRKIGPFLPVIGITGFFSGLIIAAFDRGIFEYLSHLLVGFTIALCLLTTYAVSRKIKGEDPHHRNLHFALGLAIIFLYFIQAFLGLGILL